MFLTICLMSYNVLTETITALCVSVYLPKKILPYQAWSYSIVSLYMNLIKLPYINLHRTGYLRY